MKKTILICCLVLIFALTACNSNNESNDPANSNSISDNESQVTETVDNTEHENNGLQKAVPKNLPVYPDAIPGTEVAHGGGNFWQWFYSTTGSGNEIMEFFKTELQNLGFEIDEEYTFAIHERFSVTTKGFAIQVYWLENENLPDEVVDPDTPGRGYSITVNLDEWND